MRCVPIVLFAASAPLLLTATPINGRSSIATSEDASILWEKEVFVPMRDGARLSTDVILPKGRLGPLPTMLIRTPYHKDNVHLPAINPTFRRFLDAGYAIVLQNERGHHFSEGYYEDYLEGAATDGFDTASWIAQQRWSNGKIGTFGCSSTAEHQWPMASTNPPAHAAMITVAAGAAIGDIPGSETQGQIYRGGIPRIGVWAWWYRDMAPSERLLLPRATTQEQRIRLRESFTLQAMPYFYNQKDYLIDTSSPRVDLSKAHDVLPSMLIVRKAGGALTPYDKYLTWGPGDDRWNAVNQVRAGYSTQVPSLSVNSWHDVGVNETARMFAYLDKKGAKQNYLIIASGPHCGLLSDQMLGKMEFGDLKLGDVRPNYAGGFSKMFVDWFDHFTKGAASTVLSMPKVQLHVMHKGWVYGSRWPLEQTQFTKFHLSAKDGAGTLVPTAPAAAGRIAYGYDPQDPVPSRGGGCCSAAVAVDQRQIQKRPDVITFTSAPLERPMTVAGPITLTLHVATSARDTDFIVKLNDVYPDGTAINLADDGMRLRYRDGFSQPKFAEGGKIYAIKLPNLATGNHFRKDHRIQIQVSSSDFPNYERNLNTGGNNFDEVRSTTARNLIAFGGAHHSHITLPVIP
jgi:uncharacterized protein